MGSFYRKLSEALRAENPSAVCPWFTYLKLFVVAVNKLPSCSTKVERLLVAFEDEDPSVRSSVCEVLGRPGEKATTSAVIDRLVIELGHTDPEVKTSVCQVLRSMDEKAATSGAIDHLLIFG